jgi:hypothetical protein
MANLDYSKYSFETALAQFEALAEVSETWKDRALSSTGQVFLRLLSYVIDMDGYKIDRRAEENFRRFARLRTSVVEIAWNLGYTPRRKVSAVTTLRFSSSSPPVIIPVGTVCATSGGVQFVTTEGGTITGDHIDLQAKQGKPKELSFTSDGTTFQAYTIPSSDEDVEGVENTSVVVKVDGTSWTKVASFVGQAADAEVYTLTRKGSSLVVGFGDGNNGKIPPQNIQIDGEWLESAGAAGDVPTVGAITTVVTTGLTGVTVSNTVAAQGGEDEEGIEEIRDNMSQTFATGQRGVTAADYRAILLAYAGVAKANAYGEQEALPAPPNPDNAWKVVLVVVPTGGGTLTRTQEEQLLVFLNTLKVVTSYIVFEDPTYIPVDFVVRARINTDYTLQEGNDAIETALNDLLNFQDVDLGEALRYSDSVAAIEDLAEVNSSILDIFAVKDAGDGTGSKTIFASTDAGIGAIPLVPVDRGNMLVYLEDQTTSARRRVGYDDGAGAFTSGSLIASPRVTGGSTDYETGTFSITFDVAPTANDKVIIRYQTGVPDTEVIGVGTGAATTFTGVIERNVSPDFVEILQEGVKVGEDDGAGNIVDSGSGVISGGTVNYATGDVQVVFSTPPAANLEVAVRYYFERQDLLVSLNQMLLMGLKEIEVESV